MIKQKSPPGTLTGQIELELGYLGFMPDRKSIINTIYALMVDSYQRGYLHGVSDQITGDVRQEGS